MATETDTLTTTYRVRLPKQDVEKVRQLAREESRRLGQDINWCHLLRAALRKLAERQSPLA
jgi:hypothetical protein